MILQFPSPNQKRPFLMWLLAFIICLVFYFIVAFLLIQHVAPAFTSLATTPVTKDFIENVAPILLRTAAGFTGIFCAALILKIKLKHLVAYPVISPGSFFGAALFFILLLFIKDLILMFFLGYSIVVNMPGFSLLYFLAALLFIPVHALAEEIIYRSIVMKGFSYLLNKSWFVIAVSALFFWLNHGAESAWYWLSVGIIMGAVVLQTGNILYTWGIHTAINFYNMELLSSPPANGGQSITVLIRSTAPDITILHAGDLLCLLAFLLVIIYRERKKENPGFNAIA